MLIIEEAEEEEEEEEVEEVEKDGKGGGLQLGRNGEEDYGEDVEEEWELEGTEEEEEEEEEEERKGDDDIGQEAASERLLA
ncbi:hypothetical protein E2C01_091763 [Portunus trituberculatus]|uniref:Uncharacterized protein n=1 Tax=Portunus trituberculatus TaxID=210409 RepID=A0A5B7JES7_PORTR|nr:hypothetical protein [Portunus trituberculatus]